MNEHKRALRQHFRDVRKAIPAEERVRVDGAIARQVMALPEYATCDVLLPYLSFGAEVDTRGLIRAAWEAGKVVALPWCVPGTRQMRWFRITGFDDLVRSSFGVEEPVPDPAHEQDPNEASHALAIVPGLTFDAHGYRLGYGGGFYDTFLATFSGVAVGLCREAQLSREVEGLEGHDLSVNIVVSERGITRVG